MPYRNSARKPHGSSSHKDRKDGNKRVNLRTKSSQDLPCLRSGGKYSVRTDSSEPNSAGTSVEELSENADSNIASPARSYATDSSDNTDPDIERTLEERVTELEIKVQELEKDMCSTK